MSQIELTANNGDIYSVMVIELYPESKQLLFGINGEGSLYSREFSDTGVYWQFENDDTHGLLSYKYLTPPEIRQQIDRFLALKEYW